MYHPRGCIVLMYLPFNEKEVCTCCTRPSCVCVCVCVYWALARLKFTSLFWYVSLQELARDLCLCKRPLHDARMHVSTMLHQCIALLSLHPS